jgi:hypothetical protein
MRRKYRLLTGRCAAALLTTLAGGARAEFRPVNENTVIDLTGTVSMSHKQWWPGPCYRHPSLWPAAKVNNHERLTCQQEAGLASTGRLEFRPTDAGSGAC